MKNLINLMSGLLILLLIGCATTKPAATAKPATQVYTHTPYTPPSHVAERIVINEPFENAWNKLVEKLAVNFFTIEQIDKDSRFISINASRDVSLGAEEGWWLKYVSCGASRRVITFNGKESIFTYKTIGEKPYEAVYQDGRHWYWDEIQPRVDPRIKMNIYMSPISENQTEMSVNARSEITRYFSGKRYSLRKSGEYLFSSDFDNESRFSVALTSRKPAQHPADVSPPIMCYSTGAFESTVLDLAR